MGSGGGRRGSSEQGVRCIHPHKIRRRLPTCLLSSVDRTTRHPPLSSTAAVTSGGEQCHHHATKAYVISAACPRSTSPLVPASPLPYPHTHRSNTRTFRGLVSATMACRHGGGNVVAPRAGSTARSRARRATAFCASRWCIHLVDFDHYALHRNCTPNSERLASLRRHPTARGTPPAQPAGSRHSPPGSGVAGHMPHLVPQRARLVLLHPLGQRRPLRNELLKGCGSRIVRKVWVWAGRFDGGEGDTNRCRPNRAPPPWQGQVSTPPPGRGTTGGAPRRVAHLITVLHVGKLEVDTQHKDALQCTTRTRALAGGSAAGGGCGAGQAATGAAGAGACCWRAGEQYNN